MSDPAANPRLGHGLQEWAVCCRAMDEGRLTLVVRKGGIHERGGGLFTLEQRRFALMPTFLHQDATRVLTAYSGNYFAAVAHDPAPGTITLGLWAEAVQVWKVASLARVQALGEDLAWNADELARRFAYRDQPWVYVVALRLYRLPAPVGIPDHPSYAGCRSWIPLTAALATAGSRPVLDDAAHGARLARIAAVLAT